MPVPLTKTCFAISTLAVVACTSFGQGTVVYDQRTLYSPLFSLDQSFAIQPIQPMGQSFTPTLSAVGFINLAVLEVVGNTGTAGGTIYINLHANSLTGPVLGTSETVTMPPVVSGILTCNFDTPVTVTPGTTYYFQPIVGPASSLIGTVAPQGNYAGGSVWAYGNAVPNYDLLFQEGVYVPEPSAWALLLLGAGTLIWFRRR